jgi:hypothetical protein
MWGYDSPQRYDMPVVAEHREPSTAALERSIARLIESMSPERREQSRQRHRMCGVSEEPLLPGSEHTSIGKSSDPDDQQKE